MDLIVGVKDVLKLREEGSRHECNTNRLRPNSKQGHKSDKRIKEHDRPNIQNGLQTNAGRSGLIITGSGKL